MNDQTRHIQPKPIAGKAEVSVSDEAQKKKKSVLTVIVEQFSDQEWESESPHTSACIPATAAE